MNSLTATLTMMVVSVMIATAAAPLPPDQVIDAINMRSFDLAVLAEQKYGMPVEKRPDLILNTELKDYDGWADCNYWSITIDRRVIRKDLDFVLDEILPHEYAHLVRCWIEGTVGYPDPHDEVWSRLAIALGSSGQDYRRKT